MCLNADKKDPLKGKYPLEFDEKGYVICWKAYQLLDGKLQSPCFPGGEYYVNNGWIISDRKSKEICDKNGDYVFGGETYGINRGIHVYVRKIDADGDWLFGSFPPRDEVFVIVPVRCHKSQLVAVNGSSTEAVFIKIFLLKADYDKAISGVKR